MTHPRRAGRPPATPDPAVSAPAATRRPDPPGRLPAWAQGQSALPAAGLFGGGPRIQAKLEVSEPGDPDEQEADRVAAAVLRMPDPAPAGARLQRCACGGVAGPDGACAACQGQRLGLQRQAAGAVVQGSAAPPVQAVLQQPGRPLDAATRGFMEPRFGLDFRGVRVHTDAQATESARAVSARAYTVGPHLVFGAGQYAPETTAGRHLLAHELAHVVQQNGQLARVQRQACPRRPAGEAAQSRTAGGILSENAVFSASARRLDIQDFAVNSHNLPPDVTTSPAWQEAMSVMAGDPAIRLAVTGFTDCTGGEAENFALRNQRIQAVIEAMPPLVRDRVLFRLVQSTTDFADTNTTAEGRAHNRAVRVTFSSVPPPHQEACDLIKRAASIDEYLFLVRCLEQRLNLTAPGDTRKALSVLRQIYYGSTGWSQSSTSVWARVIPNPTWSPGNDPTSALGTALMEALGASQVVGGVEIGHHFKDIAGVDIGHLLTGIDAMLDPVMVPLPLNPGLANEELATWAGDIGSAAAEWAVDVYTGQPKTDLDLYFRRFASGTDLMGDIDSFAMRAGFSPGTAPSAQLMQTIRLTGPLSNALLQYYRITSSALGQAGSNRVRNFVEAYGGTLHGNTLTNRAAFTARLRPSVEQFAHAWSLKKLLSPSTPPPPGTPAPFPPLLVQGIDEMTTRYVDWLIAHL